MMVFDVTEELFTNVRMKKIDRALKSAEKHLCVGEDTEIHVEASLV